MAKTPTPLRTRKKPADTGDEKDWFDLLPDILEGIARRVNGNDHAVLAAVCRPWRRASSATGAGLNRHSLHLVSLRSSANAVDFATRHGDIVKTNYLESTGARPHRIIGCSRGWLIVVDEACGVSFLEPVTDGSQLPLLLVTSFDCKFVTAVTGEGPVAPTCFSVDNHAYRSRFQIRRNFKVASSPPEMVPIQAMRDEFFPRSETI